MNLNVKLVGKAVVCTTGAMLCIGESIEHFGKAINLPKKSESMVNAQVLPDLEDLADLYVPEVNPMLFGEHDCDYEDLVSDLNIAMKTIQNLEDENQILKTKLESVQQQPGVVSKTITNSHIVQDELNVAPVKPQQQKQDKKKNKIVEALEENK